MANLSRPKRWAAAIAKAQNEISKIEGALSEYNDALSDLRELQTEYQDWHNNLPDNLQGSNLADKLETLANLDLDESELDI